MAVGFTTGVKASESSLEEMERGLVLRRKVHLSPSKIFV